MSRVEVFKGEGRILPGYFFRLVASNGEPISVSESFTTKFSAKRSARKVAESLRVEMVDVTVKPYRRYPA
ncbi:MAG: YegP family protein [Gemmatimonadaceae bacterium]|nr:YegP family protein [Gemmatimonadaceae bacterium]